MAKPSVLQKKIIFPCYCTSDMNSVIFCESTLDEVWTMKNLKNLATENLFDADTNSLNSFIKFDPDAKYDPQSDRAVMIDGERYFLEDLYNVNAILGYVKLEKGLHLVVSSLVAGHAELKFIQIQSKTISPNNRSFAEMSKNIYNLIVEHTDLKPILDRLFGGRYNALASE